MSQVLSYEKASVIKLNRCIDNQRAMASTIAEILATTVPQNLIVNEQQCVRAENYMVAPNQLSSTLRKDFLKISNGSQEISNVKVAALTSIVNSQKNICISADDVPIIKEKIDGIVCCSRSVAEVSAKASDVFAAIKQSHAKVFTERVASIVKDSALSIGFKDVRVSENRIVATNSSGNNLIVEIDCKDAKITSELIGITDGSCASVMKEFDNALAARGIVAKKKIQKSKIGQQRVFSDEQVVCNENKKVSIKRI